MKVRSPSIPSSLRFGLTLVIVLMVISSPVVMLVNPAVIAAPLSKKSGGSTDAAPSTISQQGDFTAQAPLQIPRTLQSTDLVNSLAFYEVTFITSTTGAIDKIRMDFPAGTNIAAAGLIERIGIGGGTLLKAIDGDITYDVTNPVSIPAGTFIRLEIFGIKNPPAASTSFQAFITTRDSGGNLIDGPSGTNVYTIKRIETDDIAFGAITTARVASSLMKTVTLTDSPAGNAKGWNPDGADTQFIILEPAAEALFAFVTIEVQSSAAGFPNHFCDVVAHGGSPTNFVITCSSAPPNGSQLQYVVENLPAFINPP